MLKEVFVIYNCPNVNKQPKHTCPDCGGEVIINIHSGNGFCIECDYTITGKQ